MYLFADSLIGLKERNVMQFSDFADLVKSRYDEMVLMPSDLLTVDVSKEALWNTYLGSFTNDPRFKVRGEHDCVTCRRFIQEAGKIVTLVDGIKQSIWDIQIDDVQYQKTADSMAALVKSDSALIDSVFGTVNATSGAKTSRALIDTTVYTFNHFYAHHEERNVHLNTSLAGHIASKSTEATMLAKSLAQISPLALQEVIQLIEENSLYRGAESKGLVNSFSAIQDKWLASNIEVNIFAWENFNSVGPAVCFIKNSAIGSLLIDISSGDLLEDAVKKFESKVAPTNYKRPTAVVSSRMVDEAKARLTQLGLIDSLNRRYANLSDISINNVLFANRNTQAQMKEEDIFSAVKTSISSSVKKLSSVVSITMDDFLKDVLPTCSTLELFLENAHSKNLVSLVTAVDDTAPPLFKWDNPFSWSYNGDLADSSIRDRVIAKGGNVTGDVCCRLAWNNYDDLDFHMVEPSKHRIYYGNRDKVSPQGGRLDVDAMAGGGHIPTPRDPVENIYYKNISDMKDGEYKLEVHQYHLTEKADSGFTVEIDIKGEIHRFSAENNPAQSKVTIVASLIKKGDIVTVNPVMDSSVTSMSLWSLPSQSWQLVSTVLFSPNHWEGEAGIGNRHLFFMLEGCVNDGNARGFYNEFLKEELTPHRKVLEIVGSKTRTQETVNQLSGVGFSVNNRREVIVRVNGLSTSVYKVII